MLKQLHYNPDVEKLCKTKLTRSWFGVMLNTLRSKTMNPDLYEVIKENKMNGLSLFYNDIYNSRCYLT